MLERAVAIEVVPEEVRHHGQVRRAPGAARPVQLERGELERVPGVGAIQLEQIGQVGLAQLEVLFATPRSDVHDAGALGRVDIAPRDDPVLDVALHRQLREERLVALADQLRALHLLGLGLGLDADGRHAVVQFAPRGLLSQPPLHPPAVGGPHDRRRRVGPDRPHHR